jgi:predicted transcriptional regulator
MANISKSIEFFPHFFKESTTIKALEHLYGNDGYAVWFKLLEILGFNSQNDYTYIAKSKQQCDYLLEKFNIDGKLLSKILNTLCDLNAIDKDKWKNQRILYVPNLINNIQKIKKKVNINTNLIEKEIKNDKIKYLEYVYLSDEEYNKLINKFGKQNTDEWIERVNDWIAENPIEKKRKKDSHYHTILNWDRRENKNQKTQIKSPQYRDLTNYNFE